MICLPTFMTGFKDVIGSWKIIAISGPHIVRICFRLSCIRSVPLKTTSPLVIAFPSVAGA